MTLRRRQLFEFNDASWAPAALRELETEALSRMMKWGRMVSGIVEPFCQLLDETKATAVLDLCSGAGGPAVLLAEAIAATGRRPPTFLLSDLHPNVAEWQRLKDEHPGVIDFVPESLDVTRLPPELARGKVCVIVNALHHFEPSMAKQVLEGASRDSAGVMVVEGLERDLRGLLAVGAWGLPSMLATPALTRSHRLSKMALAWLTPVPLLTSLWDATVSALRQYTPDELQALVADTGRTWTSGVATFQPRGRATWFRTCTSP